MLENKKLKLLKTFSLISFVLFGWDGVVKTI